MSDRPTWLVHIEDWFSRLPARWKWVGFIVGLLTAGGAVHGAGPAPAVDPPALSPVWGLLLAAIGALGSASIGVAALWNAATNARKSRESETKWASDERGLYARISGFGATKWRADRDAADTVAITTAPIGKPAT